jgi:hypothetical protein
MRHLFLTLLLLALAILLVGPAWAQCVPASAERPDVCMNADTRDRLRYATYRLSVYSRALHSRRPINIVVDIAENGPRNAHVTKNASGNGCTVHSTFASLRRDSTLAHEACHCAHDFNFLGVSVADEAHQRREKAAQACGENLIRTVNWAEYKAGSDGGWWGR